MQANYVDFHFFLSNWRNLAWRGMVDLSSRHERQKVIFSQFFQLVFIFKTCEVSLAFHK